MVAVAVTRLVVPGAMGEAIDVAGAAVAMLVVTRAICAIVDVRVLLFPALAEVNPAGVLVPSIFTKLVSAKVEAMNSASTNVDVTVLIARRGPGI